MKTYQFETIITIEAANDEDALYTYNQIERYVPLDRKSTRLNSSHSQQSRMPSSA